MAPVLEALDTALTAARERLEESAADFARLKLVRDEQQAEVARLERARTALTGESSKRERGDRPPGGLVADVLAALSKRPGKTVELADRIGGTSREAVLPALTRLERDGKVERGESGGQGGAITWQLAPANPSVPAPSPEPATAPRSVRRPAPLGAESEVGAECRDRVQSVLERAVMPLSIERVAITASVSHDAALAALRDLESRGEARCARGFWAAGNQAAA